MNQAKIKKFKDFILTESLNDIQNRMKLLILNSYLYKQSLNESFSESKDFYKGINGLSNKHKINFNKAMKSSSVLKLEDFESRYLDKLSVLNSDFKQINWLGLNDVDFIVELDNFLESVSTVLIGKISELNSIITIKNYEKFSKKIKLETLEKMSTDFIRFRNLIITILSKDVQKEYSSVIGPEVKRIKLSNKINIPKINIRLESLEESGAEYEL